MMIRKIKSIPHYAMPKIEKLISEGLAWVYRSPAERLQRAAFPPLYALHKREIWLANRHPGQVYLTTGLSVLDGQPLKVAFLGKWTPGDDAGLNYYEHALFQEGTAVREHIRAFPDREYRRQAEELAKAVDLVVTIDFDFLLWQPSSGEWTSGPSDVRMVFDFIPGQSWTGTIQRVDQEYNLRVLRKSGLTYRISRREEDFQFFYHQMHVPLIKNRYKESGGILKEKHLSDILINKNGFIMIIEDADGSPVGGGLDFIWQGVFFSYINGVLDGSQELIKKGALTAWYYFGMRMAYEQGCKRFDSGLCRAYLNDGVYIHKHRWGEEASLDYWSPASVLLWSPNGSPVALEWLKANPLLPKFASYGGPELTALYTGLKQVEVEAKPSERKSQSKPVEAEPEKRRLRFEAFDRPPKGVRERITQGLYQHNERILGKDVNGNYRPLTLTVRDGQGELIGGLLGFFQWNFLHVDTLWVAEGYRNQDLGTRLLRMAEEAAMLRDVQMIKLETTSFQAINFYRRFGYAETGQIENLPEGHTLYYLMKTLPVKESTEEAADPNETPAPSVQGNKADDYKDTGDKATQSGMKSPVEKKLKESRLD